jgi:hypothetical protein
MTFALVCAVTTSSLVEIYLCFGENYFLLRQGWGLKADDEDFSYGRLFNGAASF